jgi:hypothetical protein
VPSVLLNVVAKRSKIERFASSGRFSKEIFSRKRAPARAGKYSGCFLIERLIYHPTDCTHSSPGNCKEAMKEIPEKETARRPGTDT